MPSLDVLPACRLTVLKKRLLETLFYPKHLTLKRQMRCSQKVSTSSSCTCRCLGLKHDFDFHLMRSSCLKCLHLYAVALLSKVLFATHSPIHTPTIRSNVGFSVLPKDTLTYGQDWRSKRQPGHQWMTRFTDQGSFINTDRSSASSG